MPHRPGVHRRRLALALAGLLRASSGQYINGGSVSVSCNDCACEGSSDDGDVLVFDNPSTGQRVSEERRRNPLL